MSGPTIDLSWNGYPQALDYTVELSQAADFSTGVIASPALVVNNWTSPALSAGSWYWRVSANLPAGVASSSVYSFALFTPASNPNTSLWLDAGAGIVTDGGGLVQEWQDGSANGYTLTQSNGAERPAVNPSGLNGLPALSFSGSQFLEGGDILDIGLQSRGMFVV